jgi:hypothetical protein
MIFFLKKKWFVWSIKASAFASNFPVLPGCVVAQATQREESVRMSGWRRAWYVEIQAILWMRNRSETLLLLKKDFPIASKAGNGSHFEKNEFRMIWFKFLSKSGYFFFLMT